MALCLEGANPAPNGLGTISLFHDFVLAMAGIGLEIGNDKK